MSSTADNAVTMLYALSMDGEPIEGEVCVTNSVAVGTPRDGQDATGRNSIIEPYLAPRADFTKEFANSTKRSIRFSRPPPSTTRPSLRVEISPEFTRVARIVTASPVSVTASVTMGQQDDTRLGG